MNHTPRFARERRTFRAMIGIFCRGRHATPRRRLCADCADVLAYAEQRLDKCLFPDTKPTCANCPVHCYKPAMRTRVKEVMRFAGPRLMWHRPILALRHVLDGRADRHRDLRRRRA